MKSNNSILGASTLAVATSVRVAIQILILPIIGRMLGPHAYGQVALVSPFIFFAMMLSNSGLSACIVRADILTKELEGTIFCFSAGISLAVMAVFAALAYPAGHYFAEPAFPPLLIGMSSILLLSSFQIVPAGILLRDKKYDWLALSDIVSSVVGICTVTGCILLGWGVWSLVAQQVALWLSKIAITTMGSRARPRLDFSMAVLRENLRFGMKLTGSSIAGFISGNIDNVLIGAFMGTEALGFYALAFQIVGLPQIILSGAIYYTLFSSVSSAEREGEPVMPLFLKSLRGSILIGAPVMGGMAVSSPYFVPLIMGPKWLPMAEIIRLLAVFGVTQLFSTSISAFLTGLGNPGLSLKLTLIGSSLTILFILIGICCGSSQAVAVCVSIASLLGLAFCLRALAQNYGIRLRDVWHAIAAPLISAVIMGCGVLVLQHLLPDSCGLVIRLAASVISGIMIYVITLFVLFRDQVTADIADIMTAFSIRKRQ